MKDQAQLAGMDEEAVAKMIIRLLASSCSGAALVILHVVVDTRCAGTHFRFPIAAFPLNRCKDIRD